MWKVPFFLLRIIEAMNLARARPNLKMFLLKAKDRLGRAITAAWRVSYLAVYMANSAICLACLALWRSIAGAKSSAHVLVCWACSLARPLHRGHAAHAAHCILFINYSHKMRGFGGFGVLGSRSYQRSRTLVGV